MLNIFLKVLNGKIKTHRIFFMPLGCAGAKYGCAVSAQNHAFPPSVPFLDPKSSPNKQKILNSNVRDVRAWSPAAWNS